MQLRGFTRQTRRLYLAHVRRFHTQSDPHGAAADPATGEEVRRWILGLLRSGKSHSYANQALSALRFLYKAVLAHPLELDAVPRPRRKKQLPKVLSPLEVRRFLDALPSPKYRAVAFVLYSTGLRVSECARLKVSDVDGDRNVIHVRQGKGRKDRYVMLSPVLRNVLRAYYRIERSARLAVPGRAPKRSTCHGPDHPATNWGGRRAGRADQARHASHASPFLRHAPDGGRNGPEVHPGTARPQPPEHDRDLHQGGAKTYLPGPESRRSPVRRRGRGVAPSAEGRIAGRRHTKLAPPVAMPHT